MIQSKYAVVIVTYNREKLLRECIVNIKKQTIPASSVIIINNASTDKTHDYLEQLSKEDSIYEIINLQENIGGAGGFAKGIEAAMKRSIDCVLMIDDDAIIESSYMEYLLRARQQYPTYKAFAGKVMSNGEIDLFHRRNFLKFGVLLKNCPESEYQKENFECDIASFCGMLLNIEIIKKIGLPHAEYFIRHDDAEYSMRIMEYSKFLVVPQAILNHKTKPKETIYPRRYDWVEYYEIRNRILMVREHGRLIDKIINFAHMFVHIIFRNWLFGLVKRDNYDWQYERNIVKTAIKDSRTLFKG